MQIRCPHCHVPFDSVEQNSWADMVCPACGSSFSLSGTDATGTYRPGVQVLGHFELLQQVGAGRYGAVWKARDTQLQRTVAVKIPRQKDLDPQQTEAFLRDARAAAQLKHPRIAGVHEVGRENDTVYIVTDFVDGANLSEWLTAQRLTARESAELVVQIAEALQHAHECGVVHRDLKPSNIMLDHDGRPHVIDFGLARREGNEVAMTVEGQVLGTPAYMSPEQARGEAYKADGRSDIYAVGVILFELLTGELPFRGDARMLLVQILNEEPPSPRKLNANIPRDMETITLKCLEKEPAKRYQTAQELADDLKRWLKREPILARPIGRVERGWRWCRRNQAVAGMAAAVLAILTAGVAVSSYFAASASREAKATNEALAAAQMQQKRAEGVNAFFTEAVFGQADPNRGGHAGVGLVEALDSAASKIDARFPDDPELQAVIHDRFGGVYTHTDEPKKAVAQLEKAVAVRSSVAGDLDPEMLKSRSELGHALYLGSDIKQSKEVLLATLADQIKVLGERHPDTIKTAVRLGLVQMELAEPSNEDFEEKTYRTALDALGPHDPSTLEAEYNYSWQLRWDRKFEKALQFAEPAAKGLREARGEEAIQAMFAAYNYASCLYELQRYKEAADVFGPLLAVRTRVLGATHVDTLFTAWRVADSLQRVGDDAGALAVLDNVRAELPEIEKAGNIRRTNSLQNMIDVYVRLKRNDLAAEILKAVAGMYEAALREGKAEKIEMGLLRTLVQGLAMSPIAELRDPKRAIEIATKACELTNYQDSQALRALFFANLGTGDFAGAVKSIDKLGPLTEDGEGEYQLALVRLKAGDLAGYKEACSAMEKRFAQSANDVDRRWYTWACGLSTCSTDSLSVALEVAKGLVAKSPDDTTYQQTLGVLQYRAGNYKEAEKCLNEVIAGNEKGNAANASAVYPRYFLAMTKWKQGDKAAARQLLGEVEAATEEEMKSTTLWNRKATLELFGDEARALIQPEVKVDGKAKETASDGKRNGG